MDVFCFRGLAKKIRKLLNKLLEIISFNLLVYELQLHDDSEKLCHKYHKISHKVSYS